MIQSCFNQESRSVEANTISQKWILRTRDRPASQKQHLLDKRVHFHYNAIEVKLEHLFGPIQQPILYKYFRVKFDSRLEFTQSNQSRDQF